MEGFLTVASTFVVRIIDFSQSLLARKTRREHVWLLSFFHHNMFGLQFHPGIDTV
ncbi:hypothetical protein KCP76_05515 [Salmonella enterica subsp. enterica serovar Weltevreden]|nr:hypothetical protein KCP76_05515 [Salmonella enterica subsp. enterica serovar Weltevreden]